MQLKSNLGSVIGRLERLQAGVPEAVGKAIAPSYWKERLRQVALVTLKAQWALERNVQTRAVYERVTHRLVESMTGEMAGRLLAQYSMALQHAAEGEVSTALNFAEAAEYQPDPADTERAGESGARGNPGGHRVRDEPRHAGRRREPGGARGKRFWIGCGLKRTRTTGMRG